MFVDETTAAAVAATKRLAGLAAAVRASAAVVIALFALSFQRRRRHTEPRCTTKTERNTGGRIAGSHRCATADALFQTERARARRRSVATSNGTGVRERVAESAER